MSHNLAPKSSRKAMLALFFVCSAIQHAASMRLDIILESAFFHRHSYGNGFLPPEGSGNRTV